MRDVLIEAQNSTAVVIKQAYLISQMRIYPSMKEKPKQMHGKIRSAHAQISSNDKNLSDCMLAMP